MFRVKIIYRLIFVFLLFAVMVVMPLSLTVLKQVNNLIAAEEAIESPENREYMQIHREFSSRLIDQMLPYTFYILVMSFIVSIFFLRNMLRSLRQLEKGSHALRDGNLEIKLDVTSQDELGEVTKAFNEMASALRDKTVQLKQKDMYVEAMLDPLWVVDEHNVIIDVNPAFSKLFGYAREEAIGSSVFDFFDDRNAAIIRNQISEKRDKGIASIYEISILAKDGAPVPVLVSGAPIYSGERLIGKIGILRDFREQSALRNELQQSKDYVETIMDSIEDQLVVIDKDFRVIRANKIAMKNSKSFAIGDYCYTLAHDKSRPCWTEGEECPARAVFITGRNSRTTHQHTGEGGEKRFHEIVATPIKDSAGNVMHVIELIRDVTDRMTHEEEISNKNRELVALNSVAGILSRSLRADEIFAKVLDKMTEMLGMDGGGIYFLDDARKEMICQYHRGISEEFVKIMGRIRLGEDIPGKVAVTGQIMTTSDISKDQRIERTIIKHSGIKGYCCIPIRGKEKIIGVFCLFSFRSRQFSVEEENILNAIGEMTGIALENIKLYEKMRELYEYQRRRAEEEQTHLLSFSTKLGSGLELKEIVGRALEHIRNFSGAELVWLLVKNGEENLVLKAASPEAGKEEQVIYQKDVSSIEAYALERRMPTVVEGIRGESKFYLADMIAGPAFQTAVALPMHLGEKTVGVFTLYFSGAVHPREEELHFLRIIANILAVAIERSDYYVRSITEKGLSDTVLQSVMDGIVAVDSQGRITSVNRAFEKMAGIPLMKAVGASISEVLKLPAGNEDFLSSLTEGINRALEGSHASSETVLTSGFGKKISVLINSAPILGADGGVTGVVNMLRDVSREREIDRMKTELIRSVSHEFRTPLSAIVGMTEMIIEGDVGEESRDRYLKTILSEGVRLSNMVSDLLSIARIESGKESLRYDVVDLRLLQERLSEFFSVAAEKKGATIRYDIGGLTEISGDEEKISQILMNLIDNSLTFSDAGCTVDVKIAGDDRNLLILVSDDGWGIAEEDIPHLTERFFRGSHDRRMKGAGLGLSLCSEIVRMHGGTMDIQSRPGAGTRVTVSLPYREAR